MLMEIMVTMQRVQRETIAEGESPPASVTSRSRVGVSSSSSEKSSLRILLLSVSTSVAVELAEALTKFHSGSSEHFVLELLLAKLLGEKS